jgi:hypothetical protein
LGTVNRDGSPQVSVVWMMVQSTADGDDQLVIADLHGHQKMQHPASSPGGRDHRMEVLTATKR